LFRGRSPPTFPAPPFCTLPPIFFPLNLLLWSPTPCRGILRLPHVFSFFAVSCNFDLPRTSVIRFFGVVRAQSPHSLPFCFLEQFKFQLNLLPFLIFCAFVWIHGFFFPDTSNLQTRGSPREFLLFSVPFRLEPFAFPAILELFAGPISRPQHHSLCNASFARAPKS